MTKWPHGHLLILWGPRRETCQRRCRVTARHHDDNTITQPGPTLWRRQPASPTAASTPWRHALKGGLRATRHDSSTTPLIKHIKNQIFLSTKKHYQYYGNHIKKPTTANPHGPAIGSPRGTACRKTARPKRFINHYQIVMNATILI